MNYDFIQGIGKFAFAPTAQQLSTPLTSLTADSRQVRPGSVFVAYKGVARDGHDYIGQALAAGASAIICDHLPQNADPSQAVWITVDDAAAQLGQIASRWYGEPSRRLTLVGVTGTNGKTTIATLLYDMARLMGHKAGLLSTVANKIDGVEHPAEQTTPDPIALQRMLAQMADAGCTFCAMEVSSHACHQHRIAGLKFAGGIFTNLTRDHLDYHKTFANYLAAKKSFFDSLDSDAFALTNLDDRNGEVMLQNTRARKATYSLQSMATFRGRLIEDRLDGMLISLQGAPDGAPTMPVELETAFTGRFNAYNLTAVYGASLLLGWDREQVLGCMSQLHPVAGRMQTFRSSKGVTAIVDYAHTPDALANVLQAIAESCQGRVITVAGAGGDRDAGKRPIMGAEAAKGSDIVILTSDNPRHEDPDEIIRQIYEGVPIDRRDIVAVIADRAQAIKHAISIAQPGDAVLIAGKGHEDYQQIGDVKHHFSDAEQVLLAFNF